MNQIVFATNNAHKLAEVRDMLGTGWHIRPLADIGCHDDIPETGLTLEENARQKAHYIYDKYHTDCFADDTGLEVEALGGEPGVHSARYAGGEGHDSEANMQKLLQRLDGVDNRQARFRTVICLILDGEEHLFAGQVDGRIARSKQGQEGFGYDPLFMPEGYDETFAQLGEDLKNRISHRRRAVEQLVKFLAERK